MNKEQAKEALDALIRISRVHMYFRRLIEEITLEFPSIDDTPKELIDRHYENISDKFWKN